MHIAASIRAVEVILTSRCNLSCGYCFQNDKKNRRMDWETLRASVELLLASERDEVRLLFFGGEPLLELALMRRAVAHAESRRAPGRRLEYAVITNGTLLGEGALAFLVEHDFRTQLSFDGVPAAQEIRGRGTFARLDRLLDRLRAAHPGYLAERVSVASTVTSASIPHLADSFEYFLGKGLQEIAFTPSITHDPGWSRGHLQELDRQFRRIFDVSLEHRERHGDVPLTLFRKGRRSDAMTRDRMCRAGTGETVTIDVDGQAHGCVMFADSYQTFPSSFLRSRLDSMRLGDLRAGSFRRRLSMYPSAARATELFDAKGEKYSSYGRCATCRYQGSCGVCPVSIGHLPGNEDPRRVPDPLCAFNLASLKYRELFPLQPAGLDVLLGRAAAPPWMQRIRGTARFVGDRPGG